jgi:hypothetical protein
MWYYRTVLAAIEDAINALQSKGVSEDIIHFVHSLPDNQKGKAIGALNQNPSMMINDLKNLFQSGYRPSSQELQLTADYDPKFKSWALYQYKQLRANKLNDDPKDDRWEYKQSISGYAGIKDDLDEIHDFFRAHVLDNPNYNLGTKSFQEAYDDSVEWHRAISERGSGKFYLPFARDESGNIVDEKIVHRFDDGSMMVRVEDPNDLDVEGNFMHHCVGSYARQVESGDCTIYSLRSKFNQPQATIEVGRDGTIKQIKGPSNSEIHDDDLVEKISDFFEGRDDIKKTAGNSLTHQRAEEWYSGEVEWENGPDEIKYGIHEFAYGPYLEGYYDEEADGDFSRFGIHGNSWENKDQEEFEENNLRNLDTDELVDQTVTQIKDAVDGKRSYGKIYQLEDYDFEDLAKTIVDIAYKQLESVIDREDNLTDEYLARRSGYLTKEDIENYKYQRIRQILGNNALLSLLYNFSKHYSGWEEYVRTPDSEDYEHLGDSDSYGRRAMQLMRDSEDKLRLEIAKLIYETYQDHPVVKKFEETFKTKFILPEISTIEEGEHRAQMRHLTSQYTDPAQLRFQDLPEGESFNLARHREKQQDLEDDNLEIPFEDDFE